MSGTKFYKLTGTHFGPLPVHPYLKVGAIVRISGGDRLPGAQWNDETQCWVIPIWTECADPRIGAA